MSSAPGNDRGRGLAGGGGGGFSGSHRGRGGNGGRGGGDGRDYGSSGNYASHQGRGRGDGGGGRGNSSSYGRGGGGGGGDGDGGRGNYSSYRGRGGGGDGGRGNYYGGRGGRGGDGGGRGRGRSYSSRSDLHQASNQYSNRASTSWNSGEGSSSGIERQFDRLSLKPEENLIRFESRPPQGTIGEKFVVMTNHFRVEIDSFLKVIFHYNVSISPEVIVSKQYVEIMRELSNLYLESDMNGSPLAYDGRKSFYTFDRLPFNTKDFRVSVRNKAYVVSLSLVAVIDLEKFRQFLNGKDVELPQTVIQALDVVLRQMASSLYTPVRRSFVSPRFGTSRLGDGLEAWRGFYQSLRPTQLGLTLNIDVMAAAFIEQIPVIDFVNQILWGRDIRSVPLSDIERMKIKRALRGVRIEVTHRGNTTKTYSISGLSSMPTFEETFLDRESGSDKDIVTYFGEKYNLVLRYQALPCLKVGKKGDISLPMEVCKIVGGQRYTKKLNKTQTANMLKVNTLRPAEREGRTLQIVSENNYGKDLYCNKFGIKISESLTPVQAHKLPPPRLKYNDSGNESVCLPTGGQWNMQNKKMFMGGTINSCVCINFERSISEYHTSNFCSKLAGVCNDYGLQFNRNFVLSPRRANPDQVEGALDALYGDAMKRLKPYNRPLDLIIVILQDNNGSLYGEVKRICDTKLGVMSQCFLPKTVNNPKLVGPLTIASEKINIKAGGRNVVLEDAFLKCIPLVSDKPTIIFGADVTHPSPGNDTSPSIAAVVASLDWKLLGKYAPELSAQAARQERIENMFGMCKAHFLSFYEENRQKPERIIFFRDGVSEGQIQDVLQHELKEIQRAWMNTFNESSSPPITFLMVQKRHHTRFYPANKDPKFADRSGNVPPGTVVDTGICHPGWRDFYLNSHAGIQGTNRPAHYHILHDDNNFTEDQIQTLCNNLCYTYERCTRAVSYVTPAYYAHLLAFRGRHYLGVESSSDGSVAAEHGESSAARQMIELPRFHENLKNRMFYI